MVFFITSTIREQKTYTPSPFPAFTLRRRRQLPSSPQGFLLPASYLTKQEIADRNGYKSKSKISEFKDSLSSKITNMVKIEHDELLGLFLGKVAVALCGVFPFGRTVGFLAQVARPRPYGKNNIELSQINGEAIRGTVKPARSNTGRPKGKAKMGYDGGLFWDGGFQGGRSPTGLLDFAKQRHSKLSRIYT